jgi:hypothetical protein
MSAKPLHAAADGTSASAKVRIARRALAPAHITRHRPGGMIYREVRAALQAMVVLAAVAAFASILVVLESCYPGRFPSFRYTRAFWCPGLTAVWHILTLIVFLVAGVLCGAEEAENGTCDLTYRLPVSSGRIYAEKTIGALLSVTIWIVLSVVLSAAVLAMGLSTNSKWTDLPELLGLCISTVRIMFLPGLLFFFWGQASGAWSNNVLAGAIVGGTVAISIYFVCVKMATLDDEWAWYASYVASQRILLATSALALVLAFDRFLTREGR